MITYYPCHYMFVKHLTLWLKCFAWNQKSNGSNPCWRPFMHPSTVLNAFTYRCCLWPALWQVRIGFWHPFFFTGNKEAEWDGLLDKTAETKGLCHSMSGTIIKNSPCFMLVSPCKGQIMLLYAASQNNGDFIGLQILDRGG